MINARQLIDQVILSLENGDKIDVLCSPREANSLRVRLHREIAKLEKNNKSLAATLWVSQSTVNKGTVIITVGRNILQEDKDKIQITKADGSVLPYQTLEKDTGDESYDIERMKFLMEQDGIDSETQKKILGEETLNE